jgi:hypothetical protein
MCYSAPRSSPDGKKRTLTFGIREIHQSAAGARGMRNDVAVCASFAGGYGDMGLGCPDMPWIGGCADPGMGSEPMGDALIATPLKGLMSNPDQIIDTVMAQSIQTDAARTHPLLAWVVTRNEASHPGQYVARLVTDAVTPYVLLADTLEELRAKLPPGLVRSEHQPAGSGIVVEVWFPSAG